MLFNSYIFILLFFPLSLFSFFLFPRFRPNVSIFLLCFFSLIFYGFNDFKLVFLLLGSIIFNYCLSRIIFYFRKTSLSLSILIFSILSNLALLFVFKYYNFFFETFSYFTGLNYTPTDFALPLGISFFTFTQIAYLVDTYYGYIKTFNFSQYSLFVSFFPQLVAGPILHFRQLAPQFEDTRFFTFSLNNLSLGLTLFVIGLSKKVLIADNLSVFSDALYNSPSFLNLQFFEAWAGTLAFTFQLYFDFSGYSDMAIGLAKCFNLDLPVNFNSPYKALSLVDFWRRWHITLSNFLRDYIYIPLGGNRLGQLRKYFNLVFTMLVGGLWHGASFNFIVWGFLHGMFLALHHLFNFLFPINSLSRPYKIFSILLTFVFVNVTWVFFRSDNLSSAFTIIRSLFLLNGISLPQTLHHFSSYLPFNFSYSGFFPLTSLSGSKLLPILLLSTIIVFFAPNSNTLVFQPNPKSSFNILRPVLNTNGVFNWILCWRTYLFTAILLLFSFLCISKASPYLYYQF